MYCKLSAVSSNVLDVSISVSEIMVCELVLDPTIDDMLSGSRPLVDSRPGSTCRYIIGVYTDHLILAVLGERTEDQYELNNVIALLFVWLFSVVF